MDFRSVRNFDQRREESIAVCRRILQRDSLEPISHVGPFLTKESPHSTGAVDFLTFINEHSAVTDKVKAQCSPNFLKQLNEQLQDVYISCKIG